jgi:hypothetical protein
MEKVQSPGRQKVLLPEDNGTQKTEQQNVRTDKKESAAVVFEKRAGWNMSNCRTAQLLKAALRFGYRYSNGLMMTIKK